MSIICSNIIDQKTKNEIAEKVLYTCKQSVSLSYGPNGGTAIIEGTSLEHNITKDGNTILKSIKFNDPIALTFLDMFRSISDEQVQEVGDGSTTVIIAAYYLYDYLKNDKLINNFRPKAIVDTAKEAVKNITKKLEQYTNYITEDNKDILTNIASVSLNNDPHTGKLIGEIYHSIGLSGFINVKLSNNEKTYYENENGFKIDGGYYDKIFINSDEEGIAECTLKKPLILMFDSYINDKKYSNLIAAAINYVNDGIAKFYQTGEKPKYESLLVLAPEYGSNVKKTINAIVNNYLSNKAKNNFNFIKYNLSDHHFANIYSDLSAMVGATIIKSSLDDESIPDLEGKRGNKVTEEIKKFIDMFGGYAESSVSKEKTTVFYDTEKNEELINKIIGDITSQLQYMKENNIVNISDEYSLKKRLSIIKSNLVTIFVGGETEADRIANKFLIDDSIAACKSALENGYVIGGDITLILAAKELKEEYEIEHQNENYKEDLLYRLYCIIETTFKDVYKEVLIKVFSSEESDKIIEESIERKQIYDMISKEYTSDKIINSVKTETEIIKNVTNIITLILTSNQYISCNPRVSCEIQIEN